MGRLGLEVIKGGKKYRRGKRLQEKGVVPQPPEVEVQLTQKEGAAVGAAGDCWELSKNCMGAEGHWRYLHGERRGEGQV
jgi:hypothetical protein